MATLLGIVFSTAENQVSQCDKQTFGSNSEFGKAGEARASLAKSSRKLSAETGKVLCEPTAIFWRNEEACPQPKSCTLENLVIQFDQERFEEVLSGGGLMLRARKHRKVSTTKVSNQKPEAEFCQHPTASHVASQVPYEPKHPLPRRIWKPKQKFSAEASGVATPRPRLL